MGYRIVPCRSLCKGYREKLPGVWAALSPDGLPLPVMVVLWGPPGVGKSSLALMLADDWPDRAIVLSFELGIGGAMAEYISRLEVTKPDISQPDTWEDVLDAVQAYSLVVVDTLQASSTDPTSWRGAIVERLGKTLVMTSQVNKEGEVRGGLAAGHEADISVELQRYGQAIVRKDRFGVVPREFEWALRREGVKV